MHISLTRFETATVAALPKNSGPPQPQLTAYPLSTPPSSMILLSRFVHRLVEDFLLLACEVTSPEEAAELGELAQTNTYFPGVTGVFSGTTGAKIGIRIDILYRMVDSPQ